MNVIKSYSPATRILSLFLSLLIIFYVIPTSVFAIADDSGSENAAPLAEGASMESMGTAYESAPYEVIELREENTKHFRLEDGTYLAATYNSPVHYQDENGAWQDIDNRLFSSGSEYSTGNERIKFSKSITGNGNLFTLHENNTKIMMGLLGALKKTEAKVTSTHTSDEQTETAIGKLTNLENLSASILYEDILDGVDLEYVVHSLNVKENLIIKEKKDTYSYSFTIELNNLTAELSSDGCVYVTDNDGGLAYYIPAPIAYDASQSYAPSEAAAYTLTNNGNGKYVLTVNLSSEWMNADERAFPVTLDPTVMQSGGGLDDFCISSTDPNSNNEWDETLYVSSTQRTYIRFNSNIFAQIPSDATLIRAELSLIGYHYDEPALVGAVEILTDWDDTLTWNKTVSSNPKGLFSSKIIDYSEINSNGNRYKWNITELYNKWLNGSSNYGIGLRLVDESTVEKALFCACEYYPGNDDGNFYEPALLVSYVSTRGIEDYYSYSSHYLDRVGTGSINLADGNLTFVSDLISTTDFLLPMTLSAVYNSGMSAKDYTISNSLGAYTSSYMPYGFKLNIQETLVSKAMQAENSGLTTYYILSDGDGTEHYFYYYYSGMYFDDSALGRTLTVGTSDITIKYKDQSAKTFTKMASAPTGTNGGWYLSKITDATGNSVIISYNGSYQPTAVSLQPKNGSPIEMLKLTYSNGKLQKIYNNAAKTAVVFKYSATYNGSVVSTGSNYLRKIEFVDAMNSATAADWSAYISSGSMTNILVYETAEISYDSLGRITEVKNSSDKSIEYEWQNNSVVSVSEYSEGQIGQTLYFDYHIGSTDVKGSGSDDVIDTDDDLITHYVFDNAGRVKSYYSTNSLGTEIYGASSGSYETQENVKNNVKEVIDIGGSSTNYIVNGSFEIIENGSVSYWDISSNVSISGSPYNVRSGRKSLRYALTSSSSEYARQYLALEEGSYTLSFEYNSFEISEVNVYAAVTSLNGGSVIASEEIVVHDTTTASIEAFSMTFTLSTDTNVAISINTEGSGERSAELVIDNVVLVKGIEVGPYSIADLGHFENTLITSSGSTMLSSQSLWKNSNGTKVSVENVGAPFGRVAKVSASVGSTAGSRSYAQTVYILPEDELNVYKAYPSQFGTNSKMEFIVSGFGYSNSIILNSLADFSIGVNVYYYQREDDEDVVESYSFPFEDLEDTWQFVSGKFSCDLVSTDTVDYSCVRKIEVVCSYYGQAPKSASEAGFAYFDNISVVDCKEKNVYKYYYYEDGNLASKVGIYDAEYYEYNGKNSLTRAANDKGEMYEYVYASDGTTLLKEIYYNFVRTDINGSQINKTYPYWLANPDSVLTKTPQTMKESVYNTQGLLTSSTYGKAAYSGSEVVISGERISSTYTYEQTSGSKIYGALLTETDSLGNTTKHFYDTASGRLMASLNLGTYRGTAYYYDDYGRLLQVLPATGTASNYTALQNTENVNYTYTYDGYLSTITTDSTTYTLSYDIFGNSSSVKVGDRTLAEYVYNDYNGKLEKIIYGTGFSEEYVYNGLERLSEVWYNYSSTSREKAFEYTYYSNGLIYSIDNLLDGTGTVYKYDNSERIIAVLQYDTETMEYLDEHYVSYDSDGRVFSETYRIKTAIADTSSDGYTTHYSYNDDGSIWKEYSSTGDMRIDTEYTYDDLNRLSDVYRYSSGGFSNTVEYDYVTSGTSTSGLVGTYTSSSGSSNGQIISEYTYTYDSRGNITEIGTSSGKRITYTYDNLSQLTEEYNELLGETYTYAYDNAGNIQLMTITNHATGKSRDIPFSYANSQWGDLLTSIGGVKIIYDSIGNPAIYASMNSYRFRWKGRSLVSSATMDGKTYSFTYNDEGIRTSKTVNGVEHKYYLSGSIIMAEEWGENLLVFVYDSTGSLIGMMYRTASYEQGKWDKYWFEKNLQGDVVAIYDNSGTPLVQYVYDAWGNQKVTYVNGGENTAAQYNPFRYRGYYYDADFGFYYLNSRYYDPSIGRFINADDSLYHNMFGYNMYAYCNNNPVNYVDYSGEFPISIGIGMALCATGYALLTTSLMLLAYDVTHDQILGNMFAEAIEQTSDAINDLINKEDSEAPPQSITETDDAPALDENGKSIVKRGQQPTEKDGYIAPNGGPVKGKTKDGKVGWKDKNGNIWVPVHTGSRDAHGGGHWDVNRSDGKGYINVYPGGETRTSKNSGKLPVF